MTNATFASEDNESQKNDKECNVPYRYNANGRLLSSAVRTEVVVSFMNFLNVRLNIILYFTILFSD
jgi:hypothetical protein